MAPSSKETDGKVQDLNQHQLRHIILRVPKDQAAFLYFQLEANEGLAFYSTLDKSLHESFRDIELFSPQSLSTELNHFLSAMESQVSPLIILDEIIEDSLEAIELYSKGGKKALREQEGGE